MLPKKKKGISDWYSHVINSLTSTGRPLTTNDATIFEGRACLPFVHSHRIPRTTSRTHGQLTTMAGRFLNMVAGRLNKELKDLECKPPEGVICYPVNDSMVQLHAGTAVAEESSGTRC